MLFNVSSSAISLWKSKIHLKTPYLILLSILTLSETYNSKPDLGIANFVDTRNKNKNIHKKTNLLKVLRILYKKHCKRRMLLRTLTFTN